MKTTLLPITIAKPIYHPNLTPEQAKEKLLEIIGGEYKWFIRPYLRGIIREEGREFFNTVTNEKPVSAEN